MGSLADERNRRALTLLRNWERSSARFSETATSRAEEDQKKLVKFCTPEIASALRESGTFLIPSGYTLVEIIREVARAGVLRASETLREKPGRIFLEYVRLCVMEVMKELNANQGKQLKSFTSQQILEVIQTMPRHDAALVLDRLTFGQRNELMELIYWQLGGKGLKLSLCSESEPKGFWLWLMWYLGRLHALEPAAEQAFTKENKASQTHLLIDPTGELNPQPKNKQLEPIDLAGPMHARAWGELSRMMSLRPDSLIRANHGRPPTIAKSLNVDRSVVKRWKQHPEWDLLPKPERTKNGVEYKYTLEDMLRSARITKGNKRGSPPKNSQLPDDNAK